MIRERIAVACSRVEGHGRNVERPGRSTVRQAATARPSAFFER
ncbi:MAG TPA: hypothetical protein VEW25_06270 [Allosphingosinicella sp.]|nr:hypothetical protein [Allosphingosinicella sp.]